MSTLFSKLISPMGLVVLVCFFVPWLTVSCGSVPVLDDVSAFDLTQPRVLGSEQIDGTLELFAAPVGAVLLLVAGLVLWSRRSVLASIVALIGGAVALGIGVLFYLNVTNGLKEDPSMAQMIIVQWRVGFWGNLAASALGIIAALVSFARPSAAP